MKRSILALGALFLTTICLAEIRLDSVEFASAGEKYVYTFDYQPEENTIICWVRHYDWTSSSWETNEKRVLIQDAHTANFCRYYFRNNQWEAEIPYVYEYDNNGNLIAQSSNGQRYTWEDDTQGHLIKSCNYAWKNNEWKLYSYQESTWNDDLLISVKTYQLGNDGDFYLYSQTNNTYDENGQIISLISQNNTGQYTSKIEFIFSSNTETQVFFSWDGTISEWVYNWKLELVKNAEGINISETTYNYSTQWENDSHTQWQYDANNNMISRRYETWHNDQWTLLVENQYTYKTGILSQDVIGYVPFKEYIENAGVKGGYTKTPLLTEVVIDSEGIVSTPYTYYYSDSNTNAINDIEESATGNTINKILYNNHIYIIKGNRTYTITGAEVK